MAILKIVSKILKLPIIFYKKYITILLPKSCRYYPTCSEYAIWQLDNNNTFKAFISIILRILRCNQLFSGGIDYPIVNCPKKYITTMGKVKKINYWIVPYKNSKCMVVKSFRN